MSRYNVYERVKTLLKKMHGQKKINLDATFLPKRKRVLNKHPLRVLNKPVKKKKAVKKKGQVDALLDSQLSISSCFFDSQGCAPTSTPSSPVSLILLFAEFFGKSHARITFGCCSPSFALPFQVDPSQSQAINLSLPSKATDYHSKCTFMAACHAHACLTHAHMHVML